MTNLAFFISDWPGHFLEFIKYLAFLKSIDDTIVKSKHFPF